MIPHLTIRLYLLSYRRGTLAIEMDDVHHGNPHLSQYSKLLAGIHFSR
jgi:hypothetical protein